MRPMDRGIVAVANRPSKSYPRAISWRDVVAYNGAALVEEPHRVTDAQRRRIGVVGLAVGALMFFAGVFAAHFFGLPETNSVGQEIYPNIPRCFWFETARPCWVLPTTAQTVALIGSQIAMAAIVFGWIWKRPLTWALATVGAFLFTLELIVLLGIVPNQWLALAQGTLDWTEQRTLFTVPSWLVLNNEVKISYGAIKDVVVAGYSTVVLIVVAVGAYQLQERARRGEQPKPAVVSPYGRPVVKGDR